MWRPYDSADYLKIEADIKNYLEAVFEEPMDRPMLIRTLSVVVDLCAARLRAVQSAGTEGKRGLGDQGTVLVNLRALPRDRGDS
jgi:hypothetical protein